MKSWMAPFSARSCSSPSSILITLNGRAARSYVDYLQNTATWSNRSLLPPKPVEPRQLSLLRPTVAFALHAMAILQVHQAKALKDMNECGTNPGLMLELHSATDFALWATKVTARSLGKAMPKSAIYGSTWQR